MKLAWVVVAALTGCISSGSVECADGTVCPGGTTCRALTGPDETVCATPEQLAACASAQDGDACDAGWCHDGVCLPIICGNARADRGEECDDGNTSSGDGCSAACDSNETCGNGVLDPLVLSGLDLVPDEECDDGNLASGDGCSSRCLRETPHWSQLATQSLPGLQEHAMTYDPSRDRIVLFGGYYTAGGKAHPIADVYEYDGIAWINVPAPVSPAARQHPGLAYDGVNHRVVMFGGNLGDDRLPFDDTWLWDGGTWTLVNPATKPPARTEFGMAYDAARKRVVLFGGYDGTDMLDDTWEWDGTTWKQVATAHKPTKRYRHVMAYDPIHARIVIAGGNHDNPPTTPRDTWAFDGTDWMLLDNATTPAELDVASTMAFDVVSGKLIASTGHQNGSPLDDTTFAFNGATWTKLAISGPGPRDNAALAANPRLGTLTMFGGADGVGGQIASTYTFSNGGWQLAGDPQKLGARYMFTVANDPLHRKAWLFGGNEELGGAMGDTWSYDGTSWAKHSVGTQPEGRVLAAMAYDATHSQLVLFGGGVDTDLSALVPADTWTHDGTQWTRVTPAPSPSPPALAGAGMAYDVKRGRAVMFGGSTASFFAPTDQTWEWDGQHWSQFTGAKPPPRALAQMIYDAARERIVMYGGLVPGAGTPSLVNDVWSYDGTAWTKLADDVLLPTRLLAAFGYDPLRASPLIYGGSTLGAGSFSDTWSLSGTGTTGQLVITEVSPSPRAGASAFVDPRGRGVIVYDGVTTTDNGIYLDEIWRLDYRSQTPPELCTIDVDNDGDGLSGCADPDCWATCNPLCPPGAPCPTTAPHCGDGTCGAFETCRMCPQDCGACTAACGDTFCDAGESHASCPGDCP